MTYGGNGGGCIGGGGIFGNGGCGAICGGCGIPGLLENYLIKIKITLEE